MAENGRVEDFVSVTKYVKLLIQISHILMHTVLTLVSRNLAIFHQPIHQPIPLLKHTLSVDGSSPRGDIVIGDTSLSQDPQRRH